MVNFTSKVNSDTSIERIDYYFIRINNITLIQKVRHYFPYLYNGKGGKDTILSKDYYYYIFTDNYYNNLEIIQRIEKCELNQITELFRVQDECDFSISYFQFDSYCNNELIDKQTIKLLFNDLTSLINNQEVMDGNYYRYGDSEQYEEHMNELVPSMLLIQSNIIQELLNEE